MPITLGPKPIVEGKCYWINLSLPALGRTHSQPWLDFGMSNEKGCKDFSASKIVDLATVLPHVSSFSHSPSPLASWLRRLFRTVKILFIKSIYRAPFPGGPRWLVPPKLPDSMKIQRATSRIRMTHSDPINQQCNKIVSCIAVLRCLRRCTPHF